MELIKSESDDYQTYEDLLLRRDACRKEAVDAQVAYIRAFGELITQSFQKKIECIAQKKTIAYYQRAANRGEKVNIEELNKWLHQVMEDYNKQLQAMLSDYRACRDAKIVPEYQVAEVKAIYRKIAKLIHPDMNPSLAGNETLSELWKQTVEAYRGNDLDAMQELEVLVHRALQENGAPAGKIDIPNLRERISTVQEEIDRIISTDPYLYKCLLENSEAVERKKKRAAG